MVAASDTGVRGFFWSVIRSFSPIQADLTCLLQMGAGGSEAHCCVSRRDQNMSDRCARVRHTVEHAWHDYHEIVPAAAMNRPGKSAHPNTRFLATAYSPHT